MIDLNTERMAGRGDAIRDGMKANKLFGLYDLCSKYVTKDMSILELGCHNCVSTRLLCEFSDNVTSVDMGESRYVSVTKEKFKGFKFIRSSFHNFFMNNKTKFDLIYIDGNHIYRDVVIDINNSLNHIKPGGFLTGHDYYTTETSGVPKAVKDCLSKYGEPEIFSDSSWLVHIK